MNESEEDATPSYRAADEFNDSSQAKKKRLPHGNEKKEGSEDDGDEDNRRETAEEEEEGGGGEEEEEEFEVTQVFVFKRYHYFVVCLLSSVVFLALLEFSYTDSFKENLDAYIFLLFFIEAIFTTILQEFLLKESLLVYPISAALETTQFIMSIAAKDFL